MKYDRLYNFISPVTGKLPIDKGYILLGDKDGKSFVSPVLIDVRQDILDLKRQIGNFEELKKLDHNRIWIGDYDNEPIAQLNIGIINLPPLAEALFPNPASSITGDFRIPNPTFDYLSPFDWVMSGPFLPQIYATKYDTFGNPIGTDISSSLAMTQVRAAQIMKRFDNANFIVGSSTVTFGWENPKMYFIPETIKQLYGLGTTYTFTKAQSLGNLQTGLLKNTVTNATGTLSTAIAGKDYVEVSASIANMQLALIRPELIQEGQDVAKLLSRVARLPADNMPNLNKGKIWKGGDDNVPIEVDFPKFAPTDAKYIIKTPNTNLSEAQVLEELGTGIAKIVGGGAFAIAVSGEDYATSEQLQEYAEQAAASADEASTSAGEAATSAGEAAGAAGEASVAAGEASVSAGLAGVSAGAAAASALAAGISASSASSSASDASSSASEAKHSASNASGSATTAATSATQAQGYLNTLLTTELTLQGDITGSGLLSNPIVTTFKPNPVFTGTHMVVPGNNKPLPFPSIPGMLRFNINLQYADGTNWLTLVSKDYADSLITPQLLALSNLSTIGFVSRTGANTFSNCSIEVSTGLGISNSDGVSGNPNISLSTQLQNIHNLNTLGFVTLITTGIGTSEFVNRSLTAGTGINITNGNGVSENPTISLGSVPITSLSGFPTDSTKYLRGDGVWAIPSGGGGGVTSSIVGDIKQSIKTTDHNGWLIWQKNRVLSRTTYAALWNEVVASNLVAKGIFGNGDGSTTFTMGDIEGRHLGIAGSGTGLTSRIAGDKIGKESINEVVSHTHSISHTHSGSTDYVTHTHTMNHDHPIVTSSSNTHDHDLVTFNLNGVNSNLDTVVYQYTTQSAGNGGYIDYDASGGVTPFRAMYNVGLRKTTTVDTHNHTVDIPSFTGNTGSNLHYHGVNIDPDPTLGSGSTGVSSVNVMNPSVFFNLFIYAGS